MGLCRTVWDILVIGLVLVFRLMEGVVCKLEFEAELVSKLELTVDTPEDDCGPGPLVWITCVLTIEPTLDFCSCSLVGKDSPPSLLCGVTGLRWLSCSTEATEEVPFGSFKDKADAVLSSN